MSDAEEEDEDEWQYSETKKLLIADLLSGAIPLDSESMPPRVAYQQRPEYAESDPTYKRFPSRLRSLRLQLIDKNDRAASDLDDLAHDLLLHPPKTHNYRGEPVWEGSEYQRLFRQDMDAGLHLTKTPTEFHQSREEYYKNYPLKVFREHIHQEVRRRKFIHYLKKKAEKKEREGREKVQKAKEDKKKKKEEKKKKKEEKKKMEAEKKKKAEDRKKREEEKEAKKKAKDEEKKKKVQELANKKKKKEEEKKKKEEEKKKKEEEKKKRAEEKEAKKKEKAQEPADKKKKKKAPKKNQYAAHPKS